jgi:hypothetical protein
MCIDSAATHTVYNFSCRNELFKIERLKVPVKFNTVNGKGEAKFVGYHYTWGLGLYIEEWGGSPIISWGSLMLPKTQAGNTFGITRMTDGGSLCGVRGTNKGSDSN